MNIHASIRAMLPLAAADALDAEEMRQVEQHVRSCDECRRELDTWGVYTAGLQRLPQPSVPVHLIARTQEQVLREHEHSATLRSGSLMFSGLAIYAWVVNIALWGVARVVTGGKLCVLGTNLLSLETWLLVSFIVGGTTAVTAALALKHHGELGRNL
ncbi:MAG TPA: zf-HC2 domain-containing protein [Terriglobia bacterium]|nr:zf-HC2 domain-containing protein [Terriglobia bacterium]